MLAAYGSLTSPLTLASVVLGSGALLAMSAGCDGAVALDLVTGPQTFEITTSAVPVPPELQSGGSIASIPCPTGMCPGSDLLPLACVAGTCDPEPLIIAVPVGEVVDFDVLLRGASTVLRFLDAIEVRRVTYVASPNSLNVDVPDIEVFWGPDTAAGLDSPGVARLGVVPGLPAGTAQNGDMSIDGAGAAALSDHVVGGNRRVRFFARTSIDLDPGDPIPAGGATLTVNLTVRAVGRIVR
ncbi:MAG: hypothetical protein ACK6CU_17620 [Deltaproteobacteria bacterium]|jgi:hypothetical protein